jgi:hypothetical protein
MSQSEYEAAIAEFIRSKGITRCPTACLASAQGAVNATDRRALLRRAERLEELRLAKAAAAKDAWLRQPSVGTQGQR